MQTSPPWRAISGDVYADYIQVIFSKIPHLSVHILQLRVALSVADVFTHGFYAFDVGQ